jgi:hypothetical protein
MTMKRAPSKVGYTVEAFDPPAIYPMSSPLPVSLTPLAPDLIYEFPSSIYRIEANANEDFYLPLQLMRLQNDGSQTPVLLTGLGLEFYIRPRFEHATIIKKLTIGTGITIIDATLGYLELYIAQATVATDLLISKAPAHHWDYFFNVIDAGKITELFRGPLVVHAGIYP